MAGQLIGVFPDRETADHAIALLKDAGVTSERENAERYEDPAYYDSQLPQAATYVSAGAGEKPEQVRAMMLQAGALQVREYEAEGGARPIG